MSGGLKPVDLYDIARMCAAAHRSNPSVSGWRTVSLTEMRLTETRLSDVPHINRAAVAWHRPAFESRRAMVAVIVRPDATITSIRADTALKPDAVPVMTTVVAAAVRWAKRNDVMDIVVAGHHVGPLLSKIAAELEFGADTKITMVAFGARGRGKSARNVAFLEVVRSTSETSAIEAGRPDEYLYDIRALYEAGDLADMLRKSDTHTVIRLPAAAR